MLVVTGCGSDREAVCVSNDVGEVCADSQNGGITFSGEGLKPGSEIQMIGPDDEAFVIDVGPDGSFEPGSGSVGYLSVVADTEFTFNVAAIDTNGDAFEGDITISN
jgi:hypothetical protein